MVYSNFTLDTVVTTFQLEIVESAVLFAETETAVPLICQPIRLSGVTGFSASSPAW